MPIGHISNAINTSNSRGAKKWERPTTKQRGKDGKDFAFFIPFFLTEKKSGKNERPVVRR
jgi:hypothetical protein